MDNEKWNRRYAGEELVWPDKPAVLLEQLTADLPAGKALDLAAGEGRNSIWLARRGWDVHAVDFSDVGVDKGRKLSNQLKLQVHWEVRDLTVYTPAKGGYDLVILFYLHMPWDQISQVFRNAVSAVSDGGHLLIAGHDLSNIDEGAGGPRNPEVLYTVDMILPLLEDMTILKADKVRRPIDHEGSSIPDAGSGREPVDCVVFARRGEGI